MSAPHSPDTALRGNTPDSSHAESAQVELRRAVLPPRAIEVEALEQLFMRRGELIADAASGDPQAATALGHFDAQLVGVLRAAVSELDRTTAGALYRRSIEWQQYAAESALQHRLSAELDLFTAAEQQLFLAGVRLGALVERAPLDGTSPTNDLTQERSLVLNRALEGVTNVTGRQLAELPALESYLAHAVQEGREAYVEADRAAIALHRALHFQGGAGQRVYATLSALSRPTLAVIEDAYRDRYGVSFFESMEHAFGGRVGRLAPLTDVRALIDVLSEQFGIGAGVVSLLRRLCSPSTYRNGELLERLRARVSEPERQRVEARFSGSTACEGAATLYLSARAGRVGYLAIVQILEGSSPTELDALRREFSRRYSPLTRGQSLDQFLLNRYRGIWREYLGALLAHDSARGIHLCAELALESKELRAPLLSRLLAAPEEQRAAAREHMPQWYHDLQQKRDRVPSQVRSTLNWIRAALQGERETFAVERLHHALNGSTHEWVGEVLYAERALGMREVVGRYHSTYGDFWVQVRRKLGAQECYLLRLLVRKGELSVAARLRHCLYGIGADSEGVRRLLRNRTSEEVAEIRADYARLCRARDFSPHSVIAGLLALADSALTPDTWRGGLGVRRLLARWRTATSRPRCFDTDIERQLSGSDLFDVKLLLRGVPTTCAELAAQVQTRIDYEFVGPLAKLALRRTADGKRLLRDLESFRALTFQASDYERIQLQARMIINTCDGYRTIARAAANGTANALSLVGAIGASSVLVFTQSPVLTLCAGTAAASFATRWVAKRIIKGSGYGRHEVSLDGALACIDGATLFWGRYLRLVRVGPMIGDFLLKTTLKSAGKGFLRARALQTYGKAFLERQSGHVLQHERIADELRTSVRAELRRALTPRRRLRLRQLDAQHSVRSVWRKALRG